MKFLQMNLNGSRRLRRAVFLLSGAAVSIPAIAAASSDDLSPLTIGGFLVTAFLLPMIWSFRKESREAVHNLRDELSPRFAIIETKLTEIQVAQARQEERDRLAEILDKRLPK